MRVTGASLDNVRLYVWLLLLSIESNVINYTYECLTNVNSLMPIQLMAMTLPIEPSCP